MNSHWKLAVYVRTESYFWRPILPLNKKHSIALRYKYVRFSESVVQMQRVCFATIHRRIFPKKCVTRPMDSVDAIRNTKIFDESHEIVMVSTYNFAKLWDGLDENISIINRGCSCSMLHGVAVSGSGCRIGWCRD